ncbi:uncharacterized protein WM294_012647 [Sarcoramphus papa]
MAGHLQGSQCLTLPPHECLAWALFQAVTCDGKVDAGDIPVALSHSHFRVVMSEIWGHLNARSLSELGLERVTVMDGIWLVGLSGVWIGAFGFCMMCLLVTSVAIQLISTESGVVVAGLGTFATVQKHLFGTREVFVVRRPIFQLAIDKFWLEGLACPTEIIPGEEKAAATLCFPALHDVKVEPLNFQQVSRASGFLRRMVENCVRETILLYSFQLRNGKRFAFAFQDIGILACKGNFLCMQFYSHCITGLESTASPIALLHSRLWMPDPAVSGGATTARGVQAIPGNAFPRLQLTVSSKAKAKASSPSSTRHQKAAEKRRISRVPEGDSGKLLKRREGLPLPVLPSWGSRQQDVEKKPSHIVYPLRPGSSRRKKEAGRQEPAPPARPTSALPSSEACKRALQGVWELSEQWDEAEHLRSRYRDRVQKAQAEWAAWEAWSAGEHRQPPKELGTSGLWAPHPPAQPRSKEDKKRRRKAENPLPEEEKASAAQLRRLQPDNLSPRAAQVLKRLEPHQARQDIFKRVAEINRRKLEQQRQLPW